MSLILPGDMEFNAQSLADHIAEGWAALARVCMLKQYPLDIAQNKVDALIADGLTGPEALRKIYHEVLKT